MRSGWFPTPCLSFEPALVLLRGLLFASTLLAADPPPTLVLGIAGGWEPADAPWSLTTRVNTLLALEAPPQTRFAAVSNHRLEEARAILMEMLDKDGDGKHSDTERNSSRIILYGQSMGGAATLKLCRWLKKQKVPVRLNVQIDSVGIRDGKIPSNVQAAANLYQRDFGPIRGQSKIRAEDPARTRILGNWRYTYPPDKIFDTSAMPIGHRLILNPHLKMEFDPEVQLKVHMLIAEALRN